MSHKLICEHRRSSALLFLKNYGREGFLGQVTCNRAENVKLEFARADGWKRLLGRGYRNENW